MAMLSDILFMSLAALIVAPAGADDDQFFASGGEADGDAGWIAVKVSVDEGTPQENWFDLHLIFNGFHGPFLGHSVIYNANHEWVAFEQLWRYGPNDDVTYIHEEAPGLPPMHNFEHRQNDALPNTGYEGGFILGEPGTWTLVMWAAGGLDEWTWTATAGPGTKVLDFQSGDRTVFYAPWDFTGTVSVVKSSTYYQEFSEINTYLFLNPLVLAHAQASASLSIQNSFHGVFLAPTPGSGGGVLAVESDNGERQCLVFDCWFNDTSPQSAMLPEGDFVFTYSGASASGWGRFPGPCALCRGGPFIMGSDIPMPA